MSGQHDEPELDPATPPAGWTPAAPGVAAVAPGKRGVPARPPDDDPFRDFFVTMEERRGSNETYIGETTPTMSGSHPTVELLAFWVADEEYCVEIVDIQEIIKLPLITYVPRVHPSVLGIISLRGTIVPVIDLRALLRLDTRPISRLSRILVLRADGDPVGLLVDRVTSVVRIERETIEPKPRTMLRDNNELLEGVARINERMLIVLDVPALLSVVDSTG